MIEYLIDTLVNGATSLVQTFLQAIIYAVINLTYLLLYPIDQIILATLPALSNALTSVANLLQLASTYIGWVLSLIGLSPIAINLIVAYIVFKLTAPLMFYMFKLGLSWYRKLMP